MHWEFGRELPTNSNNNSFYNSVVGSVLRRKILGSHNIHPQLPHFTLHNMETRRKSFLICNYTPSCMHSVRPSQTGTRLQRHNENPVASSKLIQEDHGDMTRVTDAMENNPRFTHFFCHMTEPQSHLYFTVCFSKPIWRTTQTHNNCKTKEHPT